MTAPTNSKLSSVIAQLTAKHADPHFDEGLHEHTWHITAFWEAEPFRDGRGLRLALIEVLGHLPVDGVLPESLWSAESIAAAVVQLLGWCVCCRVSRPEFGEVWWWR